jgi:hypothetical protein
MKFSTVFAVHAYAEKNSLSWDEIEKLDDITLYLGDCMGLPTVVITNGATLKCQQRLAEDICERDTKAAKMYYNILIKTCKKPFREVEKLRDEAKVGIQQAVDKIQLWHNECMYWCVLGEILHNVPMKLCPGRCGVPVDSGVKLPSKGVSKLIG